MKPFFPISKTSFSLSLSVQQIYYRWVVVLKENLGCHSLIFLIGILTQIDFVFSQNVGINTTGAAPHASAMLDVDATNRGLLIPRVSLTDVTVASPVTSPATGLLVYNTNAAVTGGNGTGFYYWTGTQWSRLDNSNSADWRLTGNSGTNPATNFLGTTDNQPLVIRTNNTERMRVTTGGSVGIGTNTPLATTDIRGSLWVGTNRFGASPPAQLNFNSDGSGVEINFMPNLYNKWIDVDPTNFDITNIEVAGFTTVMRFAANNTATSGFLWRTYDGSTFTSRMWLQGSTGNLGIGTTAPTERLHVAGNLRLDNAFMPGNNAGTAGSLLRSAGAGTAPVWIAPGANGDLLTVSGGLPAWTAPSSLGGNFILNQNATDQTANFRISGTGRANTAFQAPVYTRADAGTVAIRPFNNSPSAIQLQNAGGTSILNVDATSNRVGINTTTPAYSLDVFGGNATYASVRANFPAGDGNQGLAGYIWMNAADGANYTAYIADPDGGFGVTPRSWELWEYPSNIGPGTCCRPRFRVISSHGLANPGEVVIDQAGRVGIGIYSPYTPLTIAHEASYTFPSPGSGATGAINIRMTTSNRQTGITFSQANTNNAQAGIYAHQDNAAGTHMYLATTDNYAAGPQVRMSVLNNGNVGIGTIAPNQRLRVAGGNIWLDGNQELGWEWTNTDRAFVRFESTGDAPGQSRLILETWDNSDEPIEFRQTGNVRMVISHIGPGNVGIGTTAPWAKLAIEQASGNSGVGIHRPGVSAGGVAAGLGGVAALHLFGNHWGGYSGEAIRLGWAPWNGDWNSFIETMRVHTNGNVGIGIANPVHRLDVEGQARFAANVIVRAATASEGGQVTLAGVGDYTLTGENCNSWSLDVVNFPVTERFRIFRGSAGCAPPNQTELFTVTNQAMVGIYEQRPRERLQLGDRWTFHDGGWKVISYNGYWDNPANTWRYLTNDFYTAINFTNTGHILFRTAPAGTANAAFVPADRMIITNGGNVGIDNTNPLVRLDVRKTVGHGAGTGGSSDAPTTAIITGGATARYNDWPNGWGGGLSTWDIVGASTYFSGYATRSDARFKKEILPLMADKLLGLFMQLKPVSYYLNTDKIPADDPERLRFGFIANEVEKIFPNIVVNAGMPEDVERGMEYDALIPVLVSVVQQQQKEIEALKKLLSEKMTGK
jgi:hypothetical protein